MGAADKPLVQLSCGVPGLCRARPRCTSCMTWKAAWCAARGHPCRGPPGGGGKRAHQEHHLGLVDVVPAAAMRAPP